MFCASWNNKGFASHPIQNLMPPCKYIDTLPKSRMMEQSVTAVILRIETSFPCAEKERSTPREKTEVASESATAAVVVSKDEGGDVKKLKERVKIVEEALRAMRDEVCLCLCGCARGFVLCVRTRNCV